MEIAMATSMASTLDPLILDLVEWIARAPRHNADVIDIWRTSCPRLTVWEEAMDRGLIERRQGPQGMMVVVTTDGLDALACNGRTIIDDPTHQPSPAIAR
jgi:hypothetical protein